MELELIGSLVSSWSSLVCLLFFFGPDISRCMLCLEYIATSSFYIKEIKSCLHWRFNLWREETMSLIILGHKVLEFCHLMAESHSDFLSLQKIRCCT